MLTNAEFKLIQKLTRIVAYLDGQRDNKDELLTLLKYVEHERNECEKHNNNDILDAWY